MAYDFRESKTEILRRLEPCWTGFPFPMAVSSYRPLAVVAAGGFVWQSC